MLKHAESDADIARCYPVMAELRTHVPGDGFVELIRHQQSEGYRLAYLEEGADVVAVAGYRITHNLFMGKNLYVDDLVTAERARSSGQRACAAGCVARSRTAKRLRVSAPGFRHTATAGAQVLFQRGVDRDELPFQREAVA